ncbi:hypothetical protein [Natronococcus wangiae]|uniref:hypothetical protein n=1 Tax=Natronococcus wangiae TaxID=3068275 RepID=UPI00273E3CA2|nr:hypothetical protein [Natronococcus sp. AD5]
MNEYESYDFTETGVLLEAIDKWIVLAAVVVGALVNLNALMVPLLGRIGGGTVAGFVAAYAVGRIASGIVHAVIASAVVGGIAGMITALMGVTLGLYNEPPLLVLSSLGPVSPQFSGLGLATVVLIVLAFALLTAVDGLVGGLMGSGLRTLLPW